VATAVSSVYNNSLDLVVDQDSQSQIHQVKTHLKGKKLDLAQLGKAIVDAATNSPPGKKKRKRAARVNKPSKRR